MQGSFRINGARTYNTLPRIIRQVDTLSEFKIIDPPLHFYDLNVCTYYDTV